MKKIAEHTKRELIKNLAVTADWAAAAKATGVTTKQVNRLKEDAVFLRMAEGAIEKAGIEMSAPNEAIKKFRRTQELLSRSMEEGDLSAASSMIRSHELEFRLHGLFEKDNAQKGSPVQVNIQFADVREEKVIDNDEEAEL